MKRNLILSIIVITVIALAGIGYTNAQSLRNIHIQKQVLIDGTMEEVFEQVVLLNNFPNWSPFLEADPTQEVEIKGTDGEVGAQYHWLGNGGKDVGFQEIKEIVPEEYVRMECAIQKPFVAQPVFEYRFAQVGSAVQVTQDFHLESGGADAFFMWLFGAKKNMASMNERGLALLKAHVED